MLQEMASLMLPLQSSKEIAADYFAPN